MQGIPLNILVNGDPNPNLVGFIEANGLNPMDVPINQVATIHGEKLTLDVFVRDVDGLIVVDGDKRRYVREERTVPLLSAPENHGL